MKKERKMSKKKISLVVVVAVLILTIVLMSVLLIFRADFRYRIKDFFGFGKKKAIITTLATKDIQTEKVVISEFITRKNVEFNQSLMLVNSEHKIDDGFEAETGEYKTTGVIMNTCMRDDYSDMSFDIIENFDKTLYVMSSFRTEKEQDEIYNDKSENSAMKSGYSEHQTGLALDVYINGYSGEGFINCDVGRWVNENSWKYGFVIRYPQFKEKITGIKFEPWHIRYVGFPHSEIIYRNSITLEEHIDSMKIGDFYEYDGYIFTRQKGDEITIPSDCKSYVVSEDNTGCFIITGKR